MTSQGKFPKLYSFYLSHAEIPPSNPDLIWSWTCFGVVIGAKCFLLKINSNTFTPTTGFAWVTLATNDSYSLGALVVANSLRRVETQHKLAVLITPGVTESMQTRLAEVFDLVQTVNVLDSKDAANLAVLKRPELGITFTKLHCWNLTQFEKCVFLDADVLVSFRV